MFKYNFHALIVDTLKLTQFRNYTSETLQFHPRVNVLTGLNGMGKTNILEAIYFLCLGKSYFTASDRNVIMLDKEFFRMEGDFTDQNNKEIVVIKSKIGSRKEIEISGKKIAKIGDHVGRFLCVIVAPDDIHMMLEGSEERRNFLNNTIVQMDKNYLEDLLLYNALLKRRNALLKSFADQNNFDDLLLESVSTSMYEPASRIHAFRKRYMEQMLPLFMESYGEISGQKENCNLFYQSQLHNQSLEALMSKTKERDRILARTSQGIHKDDIVFTMNGEPLKNLASQGQLKSFVLALKLTQYRLLMSNSGKQPILLLDDIFDKLDQTRVKHLLMMLIKNSYGQIFITDTSEERICTILDETGTEYKPFTVIDGKIS